MVKQYIYKSILGTGILLVLPVRATITPAQLGELQALAQKITSSPIEQADAQRLFAELMAKIQQKDRKDNRLQTVIQEITQAAEAKHIILTLDGKQITQELKGGPGAPGMEAGPRKLTPAQWHEIRLAVKELDASYKTLSLDILTKALAKINQVIGRALAPQDIAYDLVTIEEFRKELAADLNLLHKLGDEITKIYAEKKAQIHTNPKMLKEFIRELLATKIDIEEIAAVHKKNANVVLVADQAYKRMLNELYTILKKGLSDVAHLTDNAVVRKCIRAYAYAVEQFPVYSEKYFEQKSHVAILQKNQATLQRLITNNAYKVMDPQEVERQLQVLEEGEFLLSDSESLAFNEIVRYLDHVYDHLAILNQDIDEEIKQTTAYIAQKPTNLVEIDEHIDMLFAAEDVCNELLKEQEHLGGQWLPPLIRERVTKIGLLVTELEHYATAAFEHEKAVQEEQAKKHAAAQNEQEVLEFMRAWQPHIKKIELGTTPEPTAVRALDLRELTDSPAAKSIEQESKKVLRDLEELNFQ